MKSIYPAVIICIVIVVISGVVFFHKNSINIIKSPPESLAQWYKPHNKRQVWLHNMFKLRRQMQAIAFYADIKHEKNLKKWTKQFSEHYIKIATMVPQWAKKIDRDALSALHNKVKNNNYQEIDVHLKEIEQTCNNCHDDYRAITAIKYRAPDFSKLQVNSKAYSSHMKKLSHTVNQIKIASADNMKDIANESFHNLESGIIELGKTCINCHKNKKQTYPSAQMKKTLLQLKTHLNTGTLKQQGRALGTFAVQACANCHTIHRLSFDMKEILNAGTNWNNLMNHGK